MPTSRALRSLTVAFALTLAGCVAAPGIRLAAAPDHPRSFAGHWVAAAPASGGMGGGSGDATHRARQLPETLDITFQHGNLLLTSDGQLRTVPVVRGRDALDITRAGWEGDRLVVVIRGEDKGGDIVQHYDVAPDHSRLVVTTDVGKASKTASVVREFIPAPAR